MTCSGTPQAISAECESIRIASIQSKSDERLVMLVLRWQREERGDEADATRHASTSGTQAQNWRASFWIPLEPGKVLQERESLDFGEAAHGSASVSSDGHTAAAAPSLADDRNTQPDRVHGDVRMPGDEQRGASLEHPRSGRRSSTWRRQAQAHRVACGGRGRGVQASETAAVVII
jgi:hypothetical protein